MMNRLIYKTVLGILGLAVMTSCNLNRDPTDRVPIEKSMNSLDDALAWRNGSIRASLRGRAWEGVAYQDVQADELNATLEYGNNMGTLHFWENLVADDQNTVNDYRQSYSALNNLNFILETLPRLIDRTTNAKHQTQMKEILGEASFYRAYLYLTLALRYGKSYTETTAESEPSVPLILKFDVKVRPPRATNAVVYKQIWDDLEVAEANLSSRQGRANSPVITLDAVRALKARVALYMENWAQAYSLSNALISSGRYALMESSRENMEAMWRRDGTGLREGILQPTVNWPDETTATFINTYLGPRTANHTFGPRYIPTKTVLNLYEESDTRKAVFFSNTYDTAFGGQQTASVYIATKLWGNPSLAATPDPVWGTIPDGRMQPKLLRLAEQYLIAAEAAYRSGQDALTPLNALRASRGLSAVDATGETLFEEIRKERQRELIFEGFRLWDLRRWGLPLERVNPQDNAGNMLVKPFELRRQANDPKFVWPIPARDITLNSQIKQNPGY